MKKAVIFLTDGFEEMEMIVPADILHRSGVNIILTSLTDSLEVKGSHDIVIKADNLLTGDVEADMFILPGGPGSNEYIKNNLFCDLLIEHSKKGKFIAAICAAPLTLGKLGFLENKEATCYPHLADQLIAKTYKPEAVVTDGNITTGRAAGASVEFGLELARILVGVDEANRVKEAMFI